ncbi:MAG: vitamin K epoxide reductase family protein, partial [Chloroflexi bacterium]|nr:vitamin K epoxide reductase family protein [Chloroflexota bacterium]
KVTNNLAACGPIGDCESVNSSRYAEIAGIPVALLGALGYLAVLAFLVAECWLPRQIENLHLAVFGIALIGTLYSAYLTYIEVAVLRAVCPYCVISAVAMTAIFIISILRLRAAASAA